jgi:hypothetical protein
MKTLEINWFFSKRRGKRLDFFVSGKSLLKEIERRGYDLVPRLGSDLLPIDSVTRDLLLLEMAGDTPSGRVALYICPECGDIGCGVVSVKISRDRSDIVWSDLVWENNYDNNLVTLEKLGPFRFNEEDYRSILSMTNLHLHQ